MRILGNMDFLFKDHKVWGENGAILGFGSSFGGEIVEEGIFYVHYTLCPLYPMSIIPYVHYTLCSLYPMSVIPYVHYNLCPLYPMSVIPYVHYTLCPLYPMSIIPYVHYTLCPLYLQFVWFVPWPHKIQSAEECKPNQTECFTVLDVNDILKTSGGFK